MNENEAALRAKLGIPDQYTSVLILEQSAHCDWDWLTTFDGYYEGDPSVDHQAVKLTLQQALDYITAGIALAKNYTYVFCEVGYLRKFYEDTTVPQSYKEALRTYAGSSFRFASGGITSAENLLLHGEAFIRNYLIGRQWLQNTLGASVANGAVSNQLWIPDDFGHEAQLPILLQAMGFEGTGFWRIPAQCGLWSNACTNAIPTKDAPSVYLPELVGLDFTWQADDGSKVQAHWLSNSYCQGNSLGGGSTIDTSDSNAAIATFIQESSTPQVPNPRYMFVPIDCDFCTPYDNGPTAFDLWNGQSGETTYAVQATFDDFMKLIAASSEESPLPALVPHPAAGAVYPPYVPNPYFSGCYASMPRLKNAHFAAVRTLLLAEAMHLYVRNLSKDDGSAARAKLDTAWNTLVPSTHHDYITGTSPNGGACGSVNVYCDEQVSMLDDALAQAAEAQDFILTRLAANAFGTNTASVMIFNGIGITRRGVARLPNPPAGTWTSCSADGRTYLPAQFDRDGSLMLLMDCPGWGFTTVQLSTAAPAIPGVSSVLTNGVVTMSNGIITATIDGTGITSLSTVDGPNCLNGTGNALRLFTDQGNIYRFGMEIPCPNPTANFYWQQSVHLQNPTITASSGAVKGMAQVDGTFNGTPFTILYELCQGDTALRISVTGAAATSNICVMAYFEFADPAASLTFGTTSHWDTEAPRNFFQWKGSTYVEQMTFEATHEFIGVLDAGGAIGGAIYHQATPAWGIYGNGIVGCLLRNTPTTSNVNAACASDTDVHTVTYAVSPPDGLQSPQNGARTEGSMLAEALQINNEMPARNVTGRGVLPASNSIAYPVDNSSIITAIKAGTVDPSRAILRIYQPTNAALDEQDLRISSVLAPEYSVNGLIVASAVDALEQPSPRNLDIQSQANNVVELDLPFAITTLALGS